MQVSISDAWRQAFPDAHVGVLLLDYVRNRADSAALNGHLGKLETDVRRRYAGADRAGLADLDVIRAYQQHYRQFGQTYHLLGQLESVALKSRPLASPGGALVTAMFAAEIDHLLLTAGHDADVVEGDVEVDVSRGGEQYVGMGGREYVLKAGDMLMRDTAGIISAVLTGPDWRTRLLPGSTRALYVTYAPAGIDAALVREHQADIADLVRLAEPSAHVAQFEIFGSQV
jgi:DNA/RNA-binding domain of Phe-tRNA-synthetase-like protein